MGSGDSGLRRRLTRVLLLALLLFLLTLSLSAGAQPAFRFQLEADAGGLQLTTDSIGISRVEGVAPGDTLTYAYTVRNARAATLRLQLTLGPCADGSAALAGQIHLRLRTGDRVVYDGPLGDAPADALPLGTLAPGEHRCLSAAFTFPGDVLTNGYQGATAGAGWVFTVSEDPGPGPETGETSRPLLYGALAAGSLSLLAAAGRRRTGHAG